MVGSVCAPDHSDLMAAGKVNTLHASAPSERLPADQTCTRPQQGKAGKREKPRAMSSSPLQHACWGVPSRKVGQAGQLQQHRGNIDVPGVRPCMLRGSRTGQAKIKRVHVARAAGQRHLV